MYKPLLIAKRNLAISYTSYAYSVHLKKCILLNTFKGKTHHSKLHHVLNSSHFYKKHMWFHCIQFCRYIDQLNHHIADYLSQWLNNHMLRIRLKKKFHGWVLMTLTCTSNTITFFIVIGITGLSHVLNHLQKTLRNKYLYFPKLLTCSCIFLIQAINWATAACI